MDVTMNICMPIIVTILVLLWPALCVAETGAMEQGYEHTSVGIITVDPFLPFMAPVPAPAERTIPQRTEESEPLGGPFFRSPLELLTIQEIRLVGIVIGGGRRLAIVEDPKGTAYDLYKGTAVGMDEGKVVEILPDQVIIEEKKIDSFGEIKIQQTILRVEGNDRRGTL
ncbi:MAG: pilus assembly protein PilP [Syntrophales bacterium]|jgi:Tfp pilus assembly protein PilP|nr:pilus assembly protein PilP [Syntrophales bacterium]MCK9527507.1 pilus assembly protein PilP [Syntrophales bacterium]MDX9922564.1 pilus assembly protein PilP [Syntrophales bacterium]